MSAAAQSIRLPAQGYILRVGKSSAVGAAGVTCPQCSAPPMLGQTADTQLPRELIR
jgi:hypothetical protein